MNLNFPWFMSTYNSFSHPIQKIDSARYGIMYIHGGLYVDMDVKCLKPFSKMINEIKENIKDIILPEAPNGSFFSKNVSNMFIISKPKSDFWIKVLKTIEERHKNTPDILEFTSVSYITGAEMLNHVYNQNLDKVGIIPSDLFTACSICNKINDNDNNYAYHYV